MHCLKCYLVYLDKQTECKDCKVKLNEHDFKIVEKVS